MILNQPTFKAEQVLMAGELYLACNIMLVPVAFPGFADTICFGSAKNKAGKNVKPDLMVQVLPASKTAAGNDVESNSQISKYIARSTDRDGNLGVNAVINKLILNFKYWFYILSAVGS